MHPFAKGERVAGFFAARPRQPNLTLFVIYSGFFMHALSRDIERCKCFVLHAKTSPEAFYMGYLAILALLFFLHFIISKYTTKPLHRIIALVALAMMGAAFQQPAFDAAWVEPPTKAQQDRYNNVVF